MNECTGEGEGEGDFERYGTNRMLVCDGRGYINNHV